MCVLVSLVRRIIFSSVACLAVPYFSTFFFVNRTGFGEEMIEPNVCLIFSTTFV